ncbi:alpha/beta fold hydrolase [Cytobacillus gottheilii]|uniref:alpha/beta fold hydrolase n=1 Tax=Cytobacillus gottheilii TaxID=859144 RepID=UPI00083025FB|nr:alpha/beta fold hydrolase [Cytobacillus gottheilii]
MNKLASKRFCRKEYLTIDGHKHGMFIEGTSPDHPVMLYLHGGPGYPQYPMIQSAGLNWSDYVTVCYWDQRAAGMSYNSKTQGKLTIERFVQDALVVTAFLKREYKKEKIYLFGHSWGTLIGSILASTYPEHFIAYIGAGQMGRHLQSNADTVEFLLQTAIERGDQKAEEEIRKVQIDEHFYKDNQYRKVFSRYLIKYGGGMKRADYSQMKSLLELFSCRRYTWIEKLNIPKGIFMSYEAFAEQLAKLDVAELAHEFKIPVYVVQGKYDYQTSYKEAKRFFDSITAPYKKMYTFENSAHSPFLEEQEAFMEIFKDEILLMQK